MSESEVVPPKKKILSAADVFAAQDSKRVEIDVPEWGGIILVQSLTGEDAATLTGANRAEGIARIVALSCVDEQGERLFTVDDIKRLQKKSFRAMVRVQDVVMELNGMTAEVEKLLRKT